MPVQVLAQAQVAYAGMVPAEQPDRRDGSCATRVLDSGDTELSSPFQCHTARPLPSHRLRVGRGASPRQTSTRPTSFPRATGGGTMCHSLPPTADPDRK
ncbi:hypothetical protein AAFF_G00224040 [Aldrovandia affinis]|uniref:Uncharacterized protein n=1 Tax=Aldrovandia affinis TaxID=143900 RepID=A0AAD7TCC5_9TELE|nr:hypothetical protein AAFF_G00224040 [Aldrovandia affinis]